jgi:hypothetical protein
MEAIVGQQAIGAADIIKSFDAQSGMRGKVVEIGVLVDHPPLDQNAIGADTDVFAALLSRGEERRREYVPQAIEFHGGSRLVMLGLIIVL